MGQLEVKKCRGLTYCVFPPEAKQKGTDVVLNTGGTRSRCAIIQNDVIHFATQTNTPSGNVGNFIMEDYIFNQDKVFRTILNPEKIYPSFRPCLDAKKIMKSFVKLYLCRENVFPDKQWGWSGKFGYLYWVTIVTKLGINAHRNNRRCVSSLGWLFRCLQEIFGW